MRQVFRSLRTALPLAGFAMIIFLVAGFLELRAYHQYQVDSTRELTALIAAAQESDQTATDFLRQQGVLWDDFILPSTMTFARRTFVIVGLGIILFVAVVVNYFAWLHWRMQRQLRDLIAYLRDLKEQIYALRPSRNNEDDFSLLANEIYKLVVLLQETAQGNQKIRSQLEVALADISHQLRTPLTSLQIVLDNLADYDDIPATLRQEFLQSASRQVEGMSELVTTLLNLAKFDNGTIVMQPQKISARQLLRAACQKVEILADLQDVALDLDGDLGAMINLDLRWQAEALANILKNCIEHSPEHETVQIVVTKTQVFTRVAIQDHGDGISATELKHIFERFYRASNAVAGSVGIGLAFAKAIIEAEGGNISAKSQLGAGTQFVVTYFK